jgi:hypothetical protein
MSRKLAALALVLAILVCSMGLKTALSNGNAGSPVMLANGPAPAPIPPPPNSGK